MSEGVGNPETLLASVSVRRSPQPRTHPARLSSPRARRRSLTLLHGNSLAAWGSRPCIRLFCRVPRCVPTTSRHWRRLAVFAGGLLAVPWPAPPLPHTHSFRVNTRLAARAATLQPLTVHNQCRASFSQDGDGACSARRVHPAGRRGRHHDLLARSGARAIPHFGQQPLIQA